MATTKIDFKREAKELYAPSRKPTMVDVPEFQFLMVDGMGDPNTSPDFHGAANALYTLAYILKFTLKRTDGIDFVVAPLEGLWSMAGGEAFDSARPSDWRWTLMIRQPEEVTPAVFEQARAQAAHKAAADVLGRLRLERFEEGRCAQIMHIGPFATEGPTIHALHAFAEEQGLQPYGRHHEIYLSDPRRMAPERMRTVLRQPVRPR